MLGDGLLIRDMAKGNKLMKNMKMKANGYKIRRMGMGRWYGRMELFMWEIG